MGKLELIMQKNRNREIFGNPKGRLLGCVEHEGLDKQGQPKEIYRPFESQGFLKKKFSSEAFETMDELGEYWKPKQRDLNFAAQHGFGVEQKPYFLGRALIYEIVTDIEKARDYQRWLHR